MSAPAADPVASSASPGFEIKSAQVEGMALRVLSEDLDAVAAQLLAAYGPDGDNAGFFEQDALVLDFSALPAESTALPLQPLLDALKTCGLLAIAVRGGSDAWHQQAQALGLVKLPADVPRPKLAKPALETVVQEVVKEVVHEVVREVPGPVTLVIDKPLRSGQKVYARGGDLVVLAMVNAGAEVAADGHIHVYAPLRGKAMAGARGNTQARIFALSLEAELVSIAGVYRTSENALPTDVQGKAAQIRLSNDDGKDKLIFESLKT